MFVAILVMLPTIVLADSKDDLLDAWAERKFFRAEISRMDISPLDTLEEGGIFAIRRPGNAIYQTESELVLFTAGTLYTYVSGSDIGLKTSVAEFIYADVGMLIEHLHEKFKVEYFATDSCLVMIGKEGSGSITEFKARLDKEYLPISISWLDMFGYKTFLSFTNASLEKPEDIFSPPDSIEFISQE